MNTYFNILDMYGMSYWNIEEVSKVIIKIKNIYLEVWNCYIILALLILSGGSSALNNDYDIYKLYNS